MRNIAACILGCVQVKAIDLVEFDYLFKCILLSLVKLKMDDLPESE